MGLGSKPSPTGCGGVGTQSSRSQGTEKMQLVGSHERVMPVGEHSADLSSPLESLPKWLLGSIDFHRVWRCSEPWEVFLGRKEHQVGHWEGMIHWGGPFAPPSRLLR